MKTRAESFFGLHFDFHASPEDCQRPIGETLTEEDVREICRKIRPDFIQIDCKGHPGWCSYPTKTGNAMPEFCGDPLRLWRRVTAEENVALYLHYSGVVDRKYCREHPEEAVMRADGTRSAEATRTAGPYADEVLIPQLTEAAVEYGVDGAWVDGECWGTEPDYDARTVAQFEAETGFSLGGVLPTDPEKPFYREYREFCRELFRRYMRRYVNALHAAKPGFQVASNWAFTDHMPEPVTADVDFLSGDFDPACSVNSARYAGRAIAQQRRTWDLMAWNFRSFNGGSVPKHPIQIMQEAATVISIGGGFQNYIPQRRDGSPNMSQIRRMEPVAEFLRAREPFCFRGKLKHQIGVLLSTCDRHEESASLFSRNGNEKIKGLTSLLCDCGYSNEIVSEGNLEGRMNEFPVLIVPEVFRGPETKTVKALLDYARDGGRLILVGVNTVKLFEANGAKIGSGERIDRNLIVRMNDADLGSVVGSCALETDGGTTLAEFLDSGLPLCRVMPFGKGQLACVGTDLGTGYRQRSQYLHRKLICELLNGMFRPDVQLLSCAGTLEISDLIKDGEQMIQLVNANGAHDDRASATEDRIVPCFDVTLSVASEEKPERVLLQPQNVSLPFLWHDGRFEVRVDRVDLHEILQVKR